VPTFCATRAIQNAKRIRSVAPQMFPEIEPLEGFASVVPFDVLNRFHRMPDAELRQYPQLLEAATHLRGTRQTSGQLAASVRDVEDALFSGSLHLIKITFQVGATSFSVSDADLVTILEYMVLALPAISKYASQYGVHHVDVASHIEELTVSVTSPDGKYNLTNLEDWLRPLARHFDSLGNGRHCFVVCNPTGVMNTDADPSTVGGYHDAVSTGPMSFAVPYCFINVDTASGSLTLQDKGGDQDHHQFALAVSHEIAEMIVDPFSSGNPEVCDACAGGCTQVSWKAFFAVTSEGSLQYLRSGTQIPLAPSFTYDFYIAAVALPSYVDECPPRDSACNYAPDDRTGVSQLLFYEQTGGQTSGYEEFYAVDAAANMALQTTNPYRGAVSLIVRGRNTPTVTVSAWDLLYYSISHSNAAGPEGFGFFYQTGSLGEMASLGVFGNWRPSWSLIIPGKFSDSPYIDLLGVPYTDLLFYDPSTGEGEFYHTTSKGFDDYTFAAYTNWRRTWSLIIPGKFSDSPYTDLLFYDPSTGEGEFHHTGAQGFTEDAFAAYTGWRTSWSIIKAL
jgi:hypothetical protein